MTVRGRVPAGRGRGSAVRALAGEFRASGARARAFLGASFAPTQRERDALCVFFAAVAAFSALRAAVF